MSVDYFTEIDEGHAVAREGDGVGNAPSLTPGERVGTNFLVFIDELFAIRRQRDGFLNRLERDLARLNPSDQVAIVAFDGYNGTRLTDWTNSRGQIEDAIQRARERKALGLVRMLDLGAGPTPASGGARPSHHPFGCELLQAPGTNHIARERSSPNPLLAAHGEDAYRRTPRAIGLA
ncbi:MAG: VWA domain-containing protein [Holophagales bacterium]|nr:VWA domain-containing protein [Holophagales bacterium]MYA07194.1 VWA domain-containing protein [Holophagales bacterium]MYD21765.1 VWA domain-containing protein [Holophagales bacterium]MYG29532.1 VWA domain-containing protein [Holophagales bacterium]MYI32038.1 VWA domain-containing protein [Holophagales bacterium]